MSNSFTIAYLQTLVDEETFWAEVLRLAPFYQEGDLHATRFTSADSSLFSVQFHPCTMAVYPQHNGFYSLDINNPDDMFPPDPTELLDTDDELSDHHYKRLWVYMAALSQALQAEIAIMHYYRNPVDEITCIAFFEKGQRVDRFFYSLYEEDTPLLYSPKKPRTVKRLLDGRFAFVTKPLVDLDSDDDDEDDDDSDDRLNFHFHASRILPVAYRDSIYNPSTSRLYSPARLARLRAIGTIEWLG